MALRAHLRSRFIRQTPAAAEGSVPKQRPNFPHAGAVLAASSGSDDVNSSGDDQSLSDYNMDGGSPLTGRKKYEKDQASGDAGEERGSNRDPSLQESGRGPGSKVKTGQWEDSEKSIYENQLRMLQEQLVDTMIQNQTLTSEIAVYKSNNDVTQLLQKLEQETEKCSRLTQECDELHQQLENVERRSFSVEEHHSSIDSFQGDTSDSSLSFDPGSASSKPTLKSRAQEWMVNKFYELISDFTEEPEEEKVVENDQGDELAVKILKANIKRFKAGYQPIVHWIKAVGNLFSWKSAPATFLAFIISMYAIVKGWFVSLMLGLSLWHLTKTYLISKGFAIKFSLLPYSEEEENGDVDKQLGLSDKFQLVLLVARKVQNYMGMLADSLEKLHNLVMWGNPEATQTLYTSLLCAFIASIILPSSWFFICAGIFMCLKLFITNNIFRKFPRLKAKFDGAAILWQSLPTHAQRHARSTLERRRKYVIPAAVTAIPPAQDQAYFSAMFSLPPEETPLPGWHAGKRCTQIVRDKTVSLRYGKLYLTRSFLCFERSRLRHRFDKHIVIPLADVITIEKAKPFSLFPGPGMSIEVRVVSEDKPYVFGAILNRDEVFAIILRSVCIIRDLKMKDDKVKDGESSSSLNEER